MRCIVYVLQKVLLVGLRQASLLYIDLPEEGNTETRENVVI